MKNKIKFFIFPILRKIFGEQTYIFEDEHGHKFKYSGCFITYDYLKLPFKSTMTLKNDLLIEKSFQ